MEKGRLLNAAPMFYEDGNRTTWDSRNGLMFAWEVEVSMNGESVFGKAFTKNENQFSLQPNTDIVFNTDWDRSRGLPYFKSIKDANSKYANGGNANSTQGGRPQGGHGGPQTQARANQTYNPAPQQRAPQHQAPVAKPAGISEGAIKRNSLIVTIAYLDKIQHQKELNLNAETIKGVSDGFVSWIKKHEDKAKAIHALTIGVKTIEINQTLTQFELNISNTEGLYTWAEIYYEYL